MTYPRRVKYVYISLLGVLLGSFLVYISLLFLPGLVKKEVTWGELGVGLLFFSAGVQFIYLTLTSEIFQLLMPLVAHH